MTTLEFPRPIPLTQTRRSEIITQLQNKTMSPEAETIWNVVSNARAKYEADYQSQHIKQQSDEPSTKSWWQNTKEHFSFKRKEHAESINPLPVNEKGKNRWGWKTRFALGASAMAIAALGAIGYNYTQKPTQEAIVSNTHSISEPENKFQVFIPVIEKSTVNPQEVLPVIPSHIETPKEQEILVTIKSGDTIINSMENLGLEITEASLTEVAIHNSPALEEFADSEQKKAIEEVKAKKGGLTAVFGALNRIFPGQMFKFRKSTH